jgi:hypothetical protein
MVRMGRLFDSGGGFMKPMTGGTDRHLREPEQVGLGSRGVTSTAQQDPRPPWRPAVSRRMIAVGVGVLLLAAAIVVGRADVWEQRGGARSRPSQDGQVAARPLPGVPLQGPSGLRLLVASDPTPLVVDVDTGAIQPVTGLPADDDRSVHVESVGEDAVVVSRRGCRGSGCDADSVVYLVRHGSTVATRLGVAWDVESSRDGRGVWLLSRQDATHCALGQVGLDGQPRRPPRPMPCDAVLIEELPAGLLVYGPAPRNGGRPYSALVTADGAFRRLPKVVDGVAGGDLVLSTVEPGKLIALTDVGSGVSHRLPWPSQLDAHVMGLVGGHPDGRLANVAFYPARSSAEQTLDVWLLDLTARRWQRLPDMPLRLASSKPQLRWTADGRLLLLAGLADDPASLVAVWRPGEPRIAVRRVRLPESGRRGGFRYVIW